MGVSLGEEDGAGVLGGGAQEAVVEKGSVPEVWLGVGGAEREDGAEEAFAFGRAAIY